MYTDNPELLNEVNQYMMRFICLELLGLDVPRYVDDEFDKITSPLDIVKLTGLTIALNHKIWEWYEVDEEQANMYDKLWRIVDGYAVDNLKGDELSYFLEGTD